MSEKQINEILTSAAASLEMENLAVNEEWVALCKKLLENKITMEEYIAIIGKSIGVNVQ